MLATREEEAFGIAAGLYLGGRLPTVMLQSSGLGNSLNALTSLLMPYQIPVLMVVSMRGDAASGTRRRCRWAARCAAIFESIGVPHATVGVGGRRRARPSASPARPRSARARSARACCRGG